MVPAGTQFGPYRIDAPLGAGGMGEVYRARDTRLDRDVAIKILPAHFAGDPDRRQRFEREAKAVAALSHPNILAIHDVGTERDLTYLVLELLEGETLRQRLRSGPISWRKAVELGSNVADGLAAAHAKGIVHRDLKPENLFLTSDGRVKILDFGLAKVDAETAPMNETGPYSPSPTQTGTVIGTVGYMSPEQVRGQPLDPRSDIFSLGCVLHEMINGRPPFVRATVADTQTAILRDEPGVSQLSKSVAPEVERVIQHCLEKNPEERFQSARDLAFDLRAQLSDTGVARTLLAERGRRWGVVIWAGATLGVLTLAIAVYALATWLARENDATAPPVSSASVAVLPFVNVGDDPGNEYLSDGLTESLINSLSQLTDLKVIARSSAFRYKGRADDPERAGRELGVRTVLTGRVSQRDDDLVVSVELMDVASNRHLWGERYSRKLVDALAVQEEIARQISDKLRLRLTGAAEERLAKRPTANPDAYQLYLKGRFHWNKRTVDGLRRGIDYFQQAIDLDANYALAYAGLSDCHNILAGYGVAPAGDAIAKAKAAARRALALDDALAEAHTSLAFGIYVHDWDWAAAEREFKRAIELNPGYATAHHWYADYLVAVGRFDQAQEEIQRARALDPLSLIINRDVGWQHYYARRYDDAITQLRKTLEMEPVFPAAHATLARAYVQKGMFAEATDQMQKAIAGSGGSPTYVAIQGQIHALNGRALEAQEVLAQLRTQAKDRYVSPLAFAFVYLGLGDKDQTFAWLQKALAERSAALTYLKVDPIYDGIRSDPRFDELVRQMRFPP